MRCRVNREACPGTPAYPDGIDLLRASGVSIVVTRSETLTEELCIHAGPKAEVAMFFGILISTKSTGPEPVKVVPSASNRPRSQSGYGAIWCQTEP